MAYGSSPVPIDVNVAGVQHLTLVMVPAPGSIAGNDHGVWGDARLISTANFGVDAALYPDVAALAERPGPGHPDGRLLRVRRAAGHVHDRPDRHRRTGRYGLGQHQRDGGPRMPATAAMTLKDSVTGATGSAPTAARATTSPAVRPACPPTPACQLLRRIDLDLADSTIDARGLSEPTGIGAQPPRCWYSQSFTIDVNLTDGQLHDLTLYALDWDHKGPERADPGHQTPPPGACWTPRRSRRSAAGSTCSGPSAAT